VFAATQRERSGGVPWFWVTKADRRVSCFYFYLCDVDFAAWVHQSVRVLPLPHHGLAHSGNAGTATDGSGAPWAPPPWPPAAHGNAPTSVPATPSGAPTG
jgi:hypothetical protein